MTVTVYNGHVSSETRKETWRRTVLSGVRWNGRPAVQWEERKGANVLRSGLASADGFRVYVWMTAVAEGKRYLPPKAYAALTDAEVDGYWTLTPGHDRMVDGEGPQVDASGGIAQIVKDTDACMTITGVDTVALGSPRMHHWEVAGK